MNTAWLMETAARTLIMGSITLIALQVLRIEQIKARRTAWLLALGGALLMPLLVAAHIGPRILPEFARTQPSQFSAESGLAFSSTLYQDVPRSAAATPVVVSVPVDAGPTLTMLAARLALNIYMVIAALLLLRLGMGLGVALQLKWRAQRIDARRLHIRAMAKADVRISARLANPVTITSSILLPRHYLQWDAATLRIVLSHEFAHVRQKDFYVQLLAGLHCALFWFNPFSWWLQRQLSDLGEALSDHAASQQADSRASYAEVLLSFAAGAHPPFSAVAMARSSNLAPRIERLLNDRGFERSFSEKRRLPLVAAGVVIAALLVSTSVKRVVAAEPSLVTPPAPEVPRAPEIASAPDAPAPIDAPPAPSRPAPAKPPARPIPPLIARVAPMPAPEALPAPFPVRIHPHELRLATAMSSPAPREPLGNHVFETSTEVDNGGVSYMDVDNDEVFVFKSGNAQFKFNGDFKKRFGKEIPTPEGAFIFYQHQGKPYLIQDPAIVSKAQDLLAPLKEKNQRQAELRRDRRDMEFHQKMLEQTPTESKASNIEFQAAVDEVSKMLEQMKNAKLTEHPDQKTLLALQSRLAGIQGSLGRLQSEVAMQTAGEQAQLAGEHARLAAEHERLGGSAQKIINDAQRELKPLIEQAIREGKVKPLDLKSN